MVPRYHILICLYISSFLLLTLFQRSKENETLKAKLRDMEEELERVTKAKEELQTQWKELTEHTCGKTTVPATNQPMGQRVRRLKEKVENRKEKIEKRMGEKDERVEGGNREREQGKLLLTWL